MMQHYTTAEICLLGYALSLSSALLFLAEAPQVAAVPAFLAWLMLNKKNVD
jgi:hypothetical protein